MIPFYIHPEHIPSCSSCHSSGADPAVPYNDDTIQCDPSPEKVQTLPQGVSFTDCLVMATADDYETRDIFGFDKQFQDAGYNRLEPSRDWLHNGDSTTPACRCIIRGNEVVPWN